MRPEERFAQRFLHDAGLAPPYAIRDVVQDLAIIEEDAIPCGVDAVLVRASPRARPLIILQAENAPTRQTFTLAHELGHLIIPWHVGTIVCHVGYGDSTPRYIYDEIEGEANRFASEVLMPEAWIRSLYDKTPSIESVLKNLRITGVSPLAASFALLRVLGPGYLFVETNLFGVVTYAARSDGTIVPLPNSGTKFDEAELDTIAIERCTITSSQTSLRWWKLPTEVSGPDATTDVRSGRELIEMVLTDVSNDPSERRRLLYSINGIIGSANNTSRRQDLDFFSVLRTRFLNRPHLKGVVDHPLFSVFLAKKVEEIQSRD